MDVRGSDRTRQRARAFAIVLVAGVIPFWTTVAAFDPLGRLRPPPSSEPAAAPFVQQRPLLTPWRCRQMQMQRQQSLGDCTVPIHPGRGRALGPGDFPHRPTGTEIADHPGIPAPRGGI